MRSSKKGEIFVPAKGMVSWDETGKKKVVKATIIRPIRDPEWNRQQMNTRVRMSKKERLRRRKAILEALNRKRAEARHDKVQLP